jgi:hypothetical protein
MAAVTRLFPGFCPLAPYAPLPPVIQLKLNALRDPAPMPNHPLYQAWWGDRCSSPTKPDRIRHSGKTLAIYGAALGYKPAIAD